MPDSNEEESFTFEDKRRSADNSASVAESPSESVTPETDIDVEEIEPTGSGGIGSYELAAYTMGLLASDAWQKMGLIADPSTGTVNRDLTQAKFSIDCVAAIVGQMEMRQAMAPAKLLADLQRVLNDLRLNYIEQSRR